MKFRCEGQCLPIVSIIYRVILMLRVLSKRRCLSEVFTVPDITKDDATGYFIREEGGASFFYSERTEIANDV